MVTVAVIFSQRIWPEILLVWGASRNQLVQCKDHLVLGNSILHILPGYRCGTRPLLRVQAVSHLFLSHRFSQIAEEDLGESLWFLARLWGIDVGDAGNL